MRFLTAILCMVAFVSADCAQVALDVTVNDVHRLSSRFDPDSEMGTRFTLEPEKFQIDIRGLSYGSERNFEFDFFDCRNGELVSLFRGQGLDIPVGKACVMDFVYREKKVQVVFSSLE